MAPNFVVFAPEESHESHLSNRISGEPRNALVRLVQANQVAYDRHPPVEPQEYFGHNSPNSEPIAVISNPQSPQSPHDSSCAAAAAECAVYAQHQFLMDQFDICNDGALAPPHLLGFPSSYIPQLRICNTFLTRSQAFFNSLWMKNSKCLSGYGHIHRFSHSIWLPPTPILIRSSSRLVPQEALNNTFLTIYLPSGGFA